MSNLLEIRDFSLTIGRKNPRTILNSISLTVDAGETIALVGESGSGKSMTVRSALGLFPQNSSITGEIAYQGQSISRFTSEELRNFRTTEVAMIFQDPRSAINPVRSIGDFLVEGITNSKKITKSEAHKIAVQILEKVGISHPKERMGQYPHELSGGMLQRVMIAGAISSGARLLLADEPTTALDVSIQAEIMYLLEELKKDLGLAVIFVTHDIDLAIATSSRIYVMYAGQIVESQFSATLATNPWHPYTASLIASKPDLSARVKELPTLPGQPAVAQESLTHCAFSSRCKFVEIKCEIAKPELNQIDSVSVRCFRAYELKKDLASLVQPQVEELEEVSRTQKLIEVTNVNKTFKIRKTKQTVKAVDDVSFKLYRGESIGIVGESGSGKSTLGKILLGLESPDSGDIVVCDESRNRKPKNWKQRKRWGSQLQVVFQDPFNSLDPRQTPFQAVQEVINLHFPQLKKDVANQETSSVLESVGIYKHLQNSLPSELSGGQLQRVAIAKALAAKPKAIILDEAVSGLDVSIQAQVLNLLSELQESTGISYLFITHDIAVVRQLCHRTIVMQKGRIVEEGETKKVLTKPLDAYTIQLIESAPKPGWELVSPQSGKNLQP